jgi:hypothetical protein
MAMRAQVQTDRGPATMGKRSSIIASTRMAATAASLRSAMVVPPVWSWLPMQVMRQIATPAMPVTTPLRSPALSSCVPCSMWSSKKPL